MRYTNPVIPGFHPDPSICRVGRDYYLVTSSFEYFPGVPLFHSRDLVHWEQIGHCLTRRSQLPLDKEPSSRGIFAPTIRYHNGRFYMVTTHVGLWRNFYVWTDDPAGEWSEPVFVEQSGIDPSLLFDDDGTVYFTSTGGRRGTKYRPGIHQSTIDIETGAFVKPPRLVWQGTGAGWTEGPHLYHIGKWYYLMAAEGGTEYGHMECICRSRGPWGPFEARAANPILSNRSMENAVQGTGHADLVEDLRGNWWAFCLAFRPTVYPPRHHLGRETFLAPVTWDKRGWPKVGADGHIHLSMSGPLPRQQPAAQLRVRDDLDKPSLELCWNYLRNPVDADYSLTERPGWLRLRGSGLTLDAVDSPTWLGRRQEHFDVAVAALLDFEPQQDGEEAGLSVLQNEKFHYELAVTRLDGRRCIIARRRLGSLCKLQNLVEVPAGPMVLNINADKHFYHFAYTPAGQEPLALLDAECGMLAKEVAGGFTGVYVGMYAIGNGRPSASQAWFDWFDYGPSPASRIP